MRSKQSEYLDPTTVRLSQHFMLSDFMGCHSIYVNGWRNLFVDPTGSKLDEGATLAEHILEPALAHGPFSIAYGYISPDVSRLLVKYQDPDKPSYHRWDYGAACDVMFHYYDHTDSAPIFTAIRLEETLPLSRVITYSESPYICLASRISEIEKGDPRRALYENRYIGERKPLYIRYPDNPDARIIAKRKIKLDHPWRGAGYPTYHCGGGQKLEHIRVGHYYMATDFLFSEIALREGYPNTVTQRSLYKFRRAAEVMEWVTYSTQAKRFSILRAYESPQWSSSKYTWKNGIYLVLMPPEDMDVELAEYSINTYGRNGAVAKADKGGRIHIEAPL